MACDSAAAVIASFLKMDLNRQQILAIRQWAEATNCIETVYLFCFDAISESPGNKIGLAIDVKFGHYVVNAVQWEQELARELNLHVSLRHYDPLYGGGPSALSDQFTQVVFTSA